jgi:hypothetical protein
MIPPVFPGEWSEAGELDCACYVTRAGAISRVRGMERDRSTKGGHRPAVVSCAVPHERTDPDPYIPGQVTDRQRARVDDTNG